MAFAVAAAAVVGVTGRRGHNKRRQPCTSEEDVRLSARLAQQEIDLVATEYNQWCLQRNGIRANSDVSSCNVLAFLLYLTRGGYFHQTAMACGVAKSTVIAHIHKVAEFFASSAHQYIALPAHAQLPILAKPLNDNSRLQLVGHHVVLYIDGFIVKIQRPDHAGDAYFCGSHGKSCDSINVQYVTDQFGCIRHVITGLSGATHDKTAASWSAEFIIMIFLNDLPAAFVVVGDPAYRGLHPKVITTYTGANLTRQQVDFNNERQIVERTIGASQLKWRIQQLKDNRLAAKKDVLFAARCTLAAAVLHNRFTNFL